MAQYGLLIPLNLFEHEQVKLLQRGQIVLVGFDCSDQSEDLSEGPFAPDVHEPAIFGVSGPYFYGRCRQGGLGPSAFDPMPHHRPYALPTLAIGTRSCWREEPLRVD
jgi:hypothetical protein